MFVDCIAFKVLFRGQVWSMSYISTSRSYNYSVSRICGTRCNAFQVQRTYDMAGRPALRFLVWVPQWSWTYMLYECSIETQGLMRTIERNQNFSRGNHYYQKNKKKKKKKKKIFHHFDYNSSQQHQKVGLDIGSWKTCISLQYHHTTSWSYCSVGFTTPVSWISTHRFDLAACAHYAVAPTHMGQSGPEMRFEWFQLHPWPQSGAFGRICR